MSRFTVLLILSIWCVSAIEDDDSATIILRPPHAGSNRHTMFLPLFPSPPNSSRISGDALSRRHLQKSDTPWPNARMALHDDLLLNGYYTTRLWIGSPPQRFALIVDTGSTVTYVPCSTCEQCGKHQDPKFNPELSSSYKPVKCNRDCRCDNEKGQCIYERQYAEMSSSSGVLGEDIISFGNQSDLELKELHVAGKRLSLNPSVFDGKHGAVLDSGTTYAYLPEAAFVAFKHAIMTELCGVHQIKGPDPSYNDICFSGAGRD